MTVDVTGGSRPNPDPTVLGQASQDKALNAQRELFEVQIKAIYDEVLRQKATLDSTDTRLVYRLDNIPSIIDARILTLQHLIEEKFKGVDQQFAGRDVALAAALLAQKTSVDEQNKANAASSAKAESATIKQIDGIQAIIAAKQ